MELYSELTTAITGTDCTATAKWLQAYTGDTGYVARAALHWQHADQELREALASQLGFASPNGERWPVPAAIRADYEATLELAAQVLAD